MGTYNHVHSNMLTDNECVTEVGITQAPPDGKEPERIKTLWSTASLASMITSDMAKEMGLTILPISAKLFRFFSKFAPKRSIPVGRTEAFVYMDDNTPLIHVFLVYDTILQYPDKDLVLGLDFIAKGSLEINHNGQCPVLNFFYNS